MKTRQAVFTLAMAFSLLCANYSYSYALVPESVAGNWTKDAYNTLSIYDDVIAFTENNQQRQEAIKSVSLQDNKVSILSTAGTTYHFVIKEPKALEYYGITAGGIPLVFPTKPVFTYSGPATKKTFLVNEELNNAVNIGLDTAFNSNNLPVFKQLLEKHPRTSTPRNSNFLRSAVMGRKTDFIIYIMEHQPEIIKAAAQNTDHIIFYAACQGWDDMVSLLLDKGVSIAITNLKGKTLEEAATQCKQNAIKELIHERKTRR